ncbi:hypothetical protein JCM14469_38190 [Desulfatiferula olefinivorans]
MNRLRIKIDKPVSVLIKTCPQDSGIVHDQLNHILSFLGTDPRYQEISVVVDPPRATYLRQYSSGDEDTLIRVLNTFLNNGRITRWMMGPKADTDSAVATNQNWFAIEEGVTHTKTGIPVTTQLWAFDQMRESLIFQLDIDTLFFTRDHSHDWLGDMLFALQENDRAISVGFNILKQNWEYKSYHAPEGEYKPEVRCALIDVEGMRRLCPLPNGVDEDGWSQGWYHAVHQQQKKTGTVSLRGGDGRTGYIHPNNALKIDEGNLPLVRSKIETCQFPLAQIEHWDVIEDMNLWSAAGNDPVSHVIYPEGHLTLPLTRLINDGGLVVLRHSYKQEDYDDTYGDSDRGLSDYGKSRAGHWARYLKNNVDMIWSSPIKRCLDTSEILAHGNQASLKITPVLLGPRIYRKDEWGKLKRKIGWSRLVTKWLKGEVSGSIVQSYNEWKASKEFSDFIKMASCYEKQLFVTQGIVCQALCYLAYGVIEFTGTGLSGFHIDHDVLQRLR